MDTPRTNVGDATYLSRQPPDFDDITQEASFQSPDKDKNNILNQLRNGRGISLSTPRANRAPLGLKQNLPQGLADAEFTPMLKSATRNSARRRGKENTNSLATPALGRIEEDMDVSHILVESSLYGPSRNLSYVDSMPLPEVDASSIASTPLALPTRRPGNKGPLQDGNQLSLREQENVIDKIEKENFGLKLKIHFLEEALLKAGPGFSEAALKENTELKVDKVTMQRELSKYKKHLASAEKDLETYQQQILEVQERAKRKYAGEGQRAENDALRQRLEDRNAEVDDLHRQLKQHSRDDGKLDQLRDEIGDLQADMRVKDREINDREEEIDEMKTRLEEMEEKYRSAEVHIAELEQHQSRPDENAVKIESLQEKIRDLETDLREKDLEIGEKDDELNDLEDKLDKAEVNLLSTQKKAAELEKTASSNEELDEAKETIEELEASIRRFERQLDDMKEELEEAITDKNRAEGDLEELQEEMSNKSMVTKGLSRQVEEKVTRLQAELSRSQEKCDVLERQTKEKDKHTLEIKTRAEQLLRQRDSWEIDRRDLAAKLETVQADLKTRTDEKNLLQLRHDALGHESASFQRDVTRLQKQVAELEDNLDREKTHALQIDREHKRAHQLEVDRLNDDIADLQDEVQRVRKEATGGQSTSASLEREVSRLQKRINELETNLGQEKTRAQLFNKDVEIRSKKKLDQLNDDLADLRDENDRLRQEASGGQSTSASLEREVSRLQKRVNELEVSLDQETRAQLSNKDVETRHQKALDQLNNDLADLKEENDRLHQEASGGQSTSASLERETSRLQRRVKELEVDLEHEKTTARVRQNTLGDESASLQREITRLRSQVSDLELSLDQEKSHGLQIERDTRAQLKSEIDRLNEEISDLQADLHEKDNRERNNSKDWQAEKRDLESQRDRLDDMVAGLQRTIDRLRDEGGALSGKEIKLQAALNSEMERYKTEEAALERQINDLRLDLSARQATLTRVQDEVLVLHKDLRQSQLEYQAQIEKVQALEDEVEVLQATLDEESEDSSQRLREADELCQDLRRQLELARRGQVERDNHKQQLEEADRIAESLREQLEETKQELRNLEVHCVELRREADQARRQKSQQADQELSQAKRAIEDLKRQLSRTKKEAEKANLLIYDLRSQLEAAKYNVDETNPQEQELIEKLDHMQKERDAYKASVEKLEFDCDRLEKGAQKALAWIQANNARQTAQAQAQAQGAYGSRFGDMSMTDVIDTKDHEAVIRAADSARRRHEKEIRGMVMQIEWMQARWEREAKLRNDGAFAKRYLQLRLDIADACNKADLRILSRIHKDLGIKTPDEVYEMRKKPTKPVNKLKVFIAVIRSVARMRIDARKWTEHQKTRDQLKAAWDEQKRKNKLKAVLAASSSSGASAPAPHNPAPAYDFDS